MLRIDETSGTLVAPKAATLVTEVAPDRDELLALVGASWEAFSAELGMPSLRLLARDAAAGVDVLAFDEQEGRAVVVILTGETIEWQVGRALGAAAEVASWDAARLASVHEALEAAVPGDSPRLVVVAGGWEASALATVEWLARRHGVEVSAFSVKVLRVGGERLLSIRREPAHGAPDPAAEVQWMLTGGEPVPSTGAVAAAVASTPPPSH